MGNINKRGVSQLVIVALMIVFVIGLSFLIFKWVSGTMKEEGQKGSDRAAAEEACLDNVRIRLREVKEEGDFFIIKIENLDKKILNDFLVRFENGQEIDVKKARQVVGGYETANVKVEKPGFEARIIKVIPQIILEKPELDTMEKGWWLCSKQMAVYNF